MSTEERTKVSRQLRTRIPGSQRESTERVKPIKESSLFLLRESGYTCEIKKDEGLIILFSCQSVITLSIYQLCDTRTRKNAPLFLSVRIEKSRVIKKNIREKTRFYQSNEMKVTYTALNVCC